MITIKKDAMRYRDPEMGEFVGVSLIGGDAPSDNPVSGALTADEKALILKLFKNTSYSANIGAAYTQLENIFNGGDVIYHSVTYELNAITTDNTTDTVKAGFSYAAKLTDNDGIAPGVISVTMGGVDVTGDVYSMGTVHIPCVSGDVIITASKLAGPVYELAEPLSVTSATAIDTGYAPFANGDTDLTLLVNFVKTGTADVNGTVISFDDNNYGPRLANNSWGTNDPWSWRGTSSGINLTLLDRNPYSTAITHKAGAMAFSVYELNSGAISYLGDITVSKLTSSTLRYSGYKPVSVDVNTCKVWDRVLSVDELADVMGV